MDDESYRLRDYLTRVAQSYERHEAGIPEPREILARHGASEDDLPLVVDEDLVVRNAAVEKPADACGQSDPPPRATTTSRSSARGRRPRVRGACGVRRPGHRRARARRARAARRRTKYWYPLFDSARFWTHTHFLAYATATPTL
jgi:hypothetical protein